MKWMLLMSLLIVQINQKSLGMDAYNRTAGQLSSNIISTNLTRNSIENKGHEGQQSHSTNFSEGSQKNKTQTAVAKIFYSTNRTSKFPVHTQFMQRRNASTGPPNSTPVTEDQSGFRQHSSVHKPPEPSHYRKSATKPNFQTSRSKYWCAYVHTRLSPEVVIDSSSYVPIVTDPCYWSREGCTERYKMIRRPVYRMKHKIVTSLEWRCCPGYTGPQCHSKDTSTQTQLSDSQSDGHLETSDKRAATGVQATEPEGEIISMAMGKMNTVLPSLEEKLNEDKGDNIQSILRFLKTKAIQGFLKDIVQEQIKQSQNYVQESIAKIFKSLFSLSEELEVTKTSLTQMNRTLKTLLSYQMHANNKNMMKDIESLKEEVSSIKGDISVIKTNITTNMKTKYSSLEETRKKQEKTLLDDERVHGTALPESKGNENHNLTKWVSSLGDAVQKQASISLQLQQDLYTQKMRVENLTFTIGQQKQISTATYDTVAMQCKQDLLPQLEDIRVSINTVNQTLSDQVKPMNDMMNAIEEKMSHISYELEELKPMIEKDGFAGGGPIKELSDVKGLVSTVNTLDSSVTSLERAKQGEIQEEQLKGCQDGIEDALNDTMTVINKAIDTVSDKYYVLEDSLESTNQRLSEIYDDLSEKVESSSDLMPHINLLNSSLFLLQRKLGRFEDVFRFFDRFSESENKTDEINWPLTHLSQEIDKALSKLEDHETAIEQLLGAPSNSSNDLEEYKIQLQNLESRINALSLNSTTAKPKKKPPPETGLAWKYKELNRRVQDLATQMINLTKEVLWLKESDQQVWFLYQNVSGLLNSQARIPQLQQEHINVTVLQEGLNMFLQAERLTLNESVPLNPTAYLNCALTRIFKDVSDLQRQAKELDRRLDLTVILNASSILAGRSQRHTETIVDQVESLGCSHSPCQNGGTCINVQNGYVCACRSPFGGTNCTVRLFDSSLSPDLSKGSYRYAPMVTFFVAHTYAMRDPGPIKFNHLYVNYGASYSPGSGKFSIPYLGVYVFKYTIESSSPTVSGYLVVDGVDKLAFQSEDSPGQDRSSRVITGDAVLELNVGQRVWLRLESGSIPAKYPPVTTFGGYLLYCT